MILASGECVFVSAEDHEPCGAYCVMHDTVLTLGDDSIVQVDWDERPSGEGKQGGSFIISDVQWNRNSVVCLILCINIKNTA